MATHVGIGFSANQEAAIAAQEAALAARVQLKQTKIDCAIVFATAQYDPEEFVPALYEHLDHTKIVGCSTCGVILADRAETRGIGVLAIHSDTVTFETGSVSHMDLQDMRSAGTALGQNVMTEFETHQRRAFLFFIDGMAKGIGAFTDGVKEKFGQVFPIYGLGSIDDMRFHHSHQFHLDKFFLKGAAGLLLGGRVIFGASSRHGWKPLGKPRTVDSAEGPVVKTIEGKSALNLYEEFFDQEAKGLNVSRLGQINIRYPLGIYLDDKSEYMLRNVAGTLDDGSVVCQDNVTPGSVVHVMIGNTETCVQAAQQAALEVKSQLDGRKPSVVLIFESLTRLKILGRSAAEEIQAVREAIGPSIPVFGMYSYGEIFSWPTENNAFKTYLNNGSIVLMALG
ncbi:MAG: FIST N-terminal domain-containing protein [Candidatus Omnitrophota bacterium]|nr:FIST N-terminal domain-containing protein [Candidatus Omnitrophota bacterium]MDZ4242033.1 FIST N-terminal domain-containing protein [Candidatus Omnitrophota bacterium]